MPKLPKVENNKVDPDNTDIYTVCKICQIRNQQLEEWEGWKNKPKLTEYEKANIKMPLNKWTH